MYLSSHTYYSFRYGTLSVKELLGLAQQQDAWALPITDINNTSGCIDFAREAPNFGIKPIVGIDFRNGMRQEYIGLAHNMEGFYELNVFLSHHLAENIPFPLGAPNFKHAFIIYPFRKMPQINSLGMYHYIGVSIRELDKLRFVQKNLSHNKIVLLEHLSFSSKRSINMHRLLRAIDNNVLLSKLGVEEQENETAIYQSTNYIQQQLKNYPAILHNTKEILEACTIDFEMGINKNKGVFSSGEQADIELLRKQTMKGAQKRYIVLNPNIVNRIEKELEIIVRLGFTSYFLINWDIVNYAMHKNYFYVGRGSGANSIVAYCLFITDVDPIDLDLYFERFINPYRSSPPDFDIDFSWKDRDDIITYIFQKHTPNHTALLATYSTFQGKAILRELGKVMGIPKIEIEHLIYTQKAQNKIQQLVLTYALCLQGFPNHLSIHAGGILISQKSIYNYSATQIPPKGYPIVQFSMLEAEDLGLYKYDILSQRGLGHIKDTLKLIEKRKSVKVDIRNIRILKNDPDIKDLIRGASTIGCFYVESPAMRMLLTKLEADTYQGLVAASSIIRPGVAKSGMMREYILRFRDPSRRKSVHPKIDELMKETYGVMVYQEDVIKVAHYFAGLSLAEADILRRGMSGKFRQRSEFLKIKHKFFENCQQKGYEQGVVKEIWRQIESFAHYSFSKGHSASYAVESYQSLYLKAHYPLEFIVAVINNFGGFYRTELYIHEARMNGANIQPPCVNLSVRLASIQGENIYLGFNLLKSLNKNTIDAIINEREQNGPYRNFQDFIKRVSLSLEQLKILIRAGSFRYTSVGKKELLWEAHLHKKKSKTSSSQLFVSEPKPLVLPELDYQKVEDAFDELELFGFSLCSPFEMLKDPLPSGRLFAHRLKQMLQKYIFVVGYLVHIKTTSTSNHKKMHFGTFIDEKGYFIDTVHFPPSAKKYPFRGPGCYELQGKVTEEFGFYSIEVDKMKKLALLSLEE